MATWQELGLNPIGCTTNIDTKIGTFHIEWERASPRPFATVKVFVHLPIEDTDDEMSEESCVELSAGDAQIAMDEICFLYTNDPIMCKMIGIKFPHVDDEDDE